MDSWLVIEAYRRHQNVLLRRFNTLYVQQPEDDFVLLVEIDTSVADVTRKREFRKYIRYTTDLLYIDRYIYIYMSFTRIEINFSYI